MIKNPRILVLLLWAAANGLGPAIAAPVHARHSEAELVAEQATIQPGETLWLALKIRLDPGWHTYWLNPGESGMPPRLTWTLPDGFSVGAVRYPAPRRFESEGIVSFGFEEEVVALVPVTAPSSLPEGLSVSVAVKADWLVCRELCLPETARLSIEIPVGSESGEQNPEVRHLFEAARTLLPAAPEGWTIGVTRSGGEVVLQVDPPPETDTASQAAFFPAQPNLFTYDTASIVQSIAAIRLTVSPLAGTVPERVTGVLVMGNGTALTVDVPIEAKGDKP
jgi:DsbC/DsbD-like thiol-disulfide interchange protein